MIVLYSYTILTYNCCVGEVFMCLRLWRDPMSEFIGLLRRLCFHHVWMGRKLGYNTGKTYHASLDRTLRSIEQIKFHEVV